MDYFQILHSLYQGTGNSTGNWWRGALNLQSTTFSIHQWRLVHLAMHHICGPTTPQGQHCHIRSGPADAEIDLARVHHMLNAPYDYTWPCHRLLDTCSLGMCKTHTDVHASAGHINTDVIILYNF